jgi:hypothetical protein
MWEEQQNMATAEKTFGMPKSNGESKGSGYLVADREMFRAKFDKTSFQFQHRLTGHPCFSLERLLELSRETKKMRPADLYYDVGVSDLNQRWSSTPKPEFSIEEAMERLQHCGAWIILHKADKDPEYRKVLDECMAELEELTNLNLKKVMKLKEAIVFITSPKRITTYHIDRECSLLLQMRGEKQVYVFDRNDRQVISEEEIEKFWSSDHNAPRYKPETQSHATEYELRPGDGIHIPVNWPHWVQNGDNISISLNLNFQYRDTMRANIYRANYLIRKLGMKPTPPEKSFLKDTAKSYGLIPAVWAKNIYRGRKPWA